MLLTFGHFLMGFEGNGGQDPASLNIFWLALAFIIVGSGFLKANISVIVGQLYPRTDVRRDGAYTIFYMGINLGAFLGALLCGYLGETYGWSYGFGAAGVGMLLGLIVFILGKPLLLGRGEAPDPVKLASPVMGIKLEWLIYLVGLVAVGAVLVDGAESGRRRHVAGRRGRGAGRLCALYRGGQAAARRSRPHLCRDVPDPRLDPVLGAVRTGGLVAQPVHRSLCRSRRGAGIGVPVDQRDLHRAAGAVVRRAVDVARPPQHGAFGTCQIRPGDAAARPWLPRPRGAPKRWASAARRRCCSSS